MKNITRKIKFFITEADKIVSKDGQLKSETLPSLETTKKLSRVALEKHFKSQITEGETFILKNTIEKEKTFSMDLDNFIKNSVEVQE